MDEILRLMETVASDMDLTTDRGKAVFVGMVFPLVVSIHNPEDRDFARAFMGTLIGRSITEDDNDGIIDAFHMQMHVFQEHN